MLTLHPHKPAHSNTNSTCCSPSRFPLVGMRLVCRHSAVRLLLLSLTYCIYCAIQQGSYSNNEIKFQDIPGWIELNFQDFSDSDVVHHTSVAINMLSSGRKSCEGHDRRRRTIYFGLFCGDKAFSSMFLIKLIC